ncbi:hypothetical protein Rin_00011530 [Candidatus Regiella insecticola 5.15]|uniref:Uncharacterized protein n=1 Tax=Candidatus Regiella insecticola 5.15 TaxID=1005043 RepID=G2GZD8_9ENTR|nr:hypothetical protein [Candidatus Regiella insecticola]EGY28891.1 hypothetical protein Rin_00011530 [Candidatus Regiella insecticola 5.15]
MEENLQAASSHYPLFVDHSIIAAALLAAGCSLYPMNFELRQGGNQADPGSVQIVHDRG